MSDIESGDDRPPRLVAFIDGLTQLLTIVRADDLEPAPERTDWATHRELLETARRLTLEVVSLAAEGVFSAMKDAAELDNLCEGYAEVLGEIAGLLWAAREREAASEILAAAARKGRGPQSELAAEGLDDPESFVRLIRAWWLYRHQRYPEAQALVRKLARLSHLPRISASAQQLLDIHHTPPPPVKVWLWLLLAVLLTAGFAYVVNYDRLRGPFMYG